MLRVALISLALVCFAGCASTPSTVDTARRQADASTVVALSLVEAESGFDDAASLASVVDRTAVEVASAASDGDLGARDVVELAIALSGDRLSGPWSAIGRLVVELASATLPATEGRPADERLAWIEAVAIGISDGVDYWRGLSDPDLVGTRSAWPAQPYRWLD